MPYRCPLKKICLIFCGGTTLSSSRFLETSVFKKEDIKNWMGQVPELEIIADIDPIFFAGENSKITPALWTELAKIIFQKLNNCDGFVIVHPLSSLLYTACALSFALLNLAKPIILTSSLAGKQIAENLKNYEELNFKANLINACHIATLDIAEVAIVFGNRLIRGNQACQNFNNIFSPFLAYRSEPLAKIDIGITLSLQRQIRTAALHTKLMPNFNGKIFIYEDFPGCDEIVLNEIHQFGYHGIIIKSEKDPRFFSIHFKNLLKFKIPVLIYSSLAQKFFGLEPPPIKMTFEAFLIKFTWLLAQTDDQNKINQLMRQPFAREL